MKIKNIIYSILLVLSLLSFSYLANSASDTSSGINLSDLVTSDQIQIKSDQDFIDFGFSGTGSESDPYLIENLEIMGDSFSDNIEIKDTTKYFIVQNCYLKSGSHAVDIIDAAPGTVQVINNICEGNKYRGLWLENTVDAYIANNEMIENAVCGIRLENCSNILITENTLEDYSDVPLCAIAIALGNSVDITVTWNIMINQFYSGIGLMHTNDSLIAYNHIEQHNEYSIKANFGCYNNVIHHNNNIDNNLDATGESQASDAGVDNFWYEDATSEGNYWSDWSGEGNYDLIGAASCCDPYPLSKPHDIIGSASFPYYLFILSFIPITYIIRRKRNR
ncbi:MAG: right-handed parallel beta-helix repeat-containing protein [Candidatus Heimdallarchaeaceae archaeon]